MKILCETEISDRLMPSMCSAGQKNKRSRSLISIGYQPGTPNDAAHLNLLVCTGQNKSGAKYKIHKNIETVFSKFLHDGKATIRFCCPPHDLLISKADFLSLNNFLKVLHGIITGKAAAPTTLSKLTPALAKQVEAPKVKLEIRDQQLYHAQLMFDRRLRVLIINECRMTKFDERILKLTNLRILDLSKNLLDHIPVELGTLNLERLSLSNNELQSVPGDLFSAAFRTSLSMLDLSSNKLLEFNTSICELLKLSTLKLDFNCIKQLPTRIGKLRGLTALTISHNELSFLPASLKFMRLHTIDVSVNPFITNLPKNGIKTKSLSPDCTTSLLELSCRSVIKNRILYQEDDLPSILIKKLAEHQICVCGQPFVESKYQYYGNLDLKAIASTVVYMQNCDSSTIVPISGMLCCAGCN